MKRFKNVFSSFYNTLLDHYNFKAPEEEEEEPLVIVSTDITPATLYIAEENTVYPDVTVEFEGEEGVTGTDLWEMTIFFNKNGDGSGKRTSEATNTLTQNQKDQPLVLTESLVFEVCLNILPVRNAGPSIR